MWTTRLYLLHILKTIFWQNLLCIKSSHHIPYDYFSQSAFRLLNAGLRKSSSLYCRKLVSVVANNSANAGKIKPYAVGLKRHLKVITGDTWLTQFCRIFTHTRCLVEGLYLLCNKNKFNYTCIFYKVVTFKNPSLKGNEIFKTAKVKKSKISCY